MPWTEFINLLSGLMPDTPLGQIVAIRAEKDPKILKNFSPDQRRIRRDWQNREAAKRMNNAELLDKDMKSLERALELAFGNKK